MKRQGRPGSRGRGRPPDRRPIRIRLEIEDPHTARIGLQRFLDWTAGRMCGPPWGADRATAAYRAVRPLLTQAYAAERLDD